jgi:hypothetical protein
MPTIKIDDLRPTGAELFSDSESYMNELGDGELELNYGGATPTIVVSISARVAAKSSMRCLNVSIKATKWRPHQNTPISPAVVSGIKKLSNPFNSF